MGAYINPEDMSKEQWLQENATFIAYVPTFDPSDGCFPVCLVDAGFHTAAAIAHSAEELERFNHPDDNRYKQWYLAKIEDLHKVSPELKRYLKDEKKAN